MSGQEDNKYGQRGTSSVGGGGVDNPPYIYSFSIATWSGTSAPFVIEITSATHNQGIDNTVGYSVIEVDGNGNAANVGIDGFVRSNGDVRLETDEKFNGYVVIGAFK